MIVWILLALILGIWIGVELSKLFHKEMIKQILKDAGVSNHDLQQAQRHIQTQMYEEQTPTEVDINVEQHSGCYYAFRKSNDEFLGQGEDYVTLLTALQRRLGTKTSVNLEYDVAKDIPGFPQK
jgi:hypothetical protein